MHIKLLTNISYTILWQSVGPKHNDINARDVQKRFFNLGSVSVRFLKKTRIRFEMSLVRFSSKNSVRFGYYSYLLLM